MVTTVVWWFICTSITYNNMYQECMIWCYSYTEVFSYASPASWIPLKLVRYVWLVTTLSSSWPNVLSVILPAYHLYVAHSCLAHRTSKLQCKQTTALQVVFNSVFQLTVRGQKCMTSALTI